MININVKLCMRSNDNVTAPRSGSRGGNLPIRPRRQSRTVSRIGCAEQLRFSTWNCSGLSATQNNCALSWVMTFLVSLRLTTPEVSRNHYRSFLLNLLLRTTVLLVLHYYFPITFHAALCIPTQLVHGLRSNSRGDLQHLRNLYLCPALKSR